MSMPSLSLVTAISAASLMIIFQIGAAQIRRAFGDTERFHFRAQLDAFAMHAQDFFAAF